MKQKVKGNHNHYAIALKLFAMFCVPFEQNEINEDKGMITKPVAIMEAIQIVCTHFYNKLKIEIPCHFTNGCIWEISKDFSIQIHEQYDSGFIETQVELYNHQTIISQQTFYNKFLSNNY